MKAYTKHTAFILCMASAFLTLNAQGADDTSAKAEAARPIDPRAKEEIEALKVKARQGDADAQCLLGLHYFRGSGVAQDDVEAYGYLSLSIVDCAPYEGSTARIILNNKLVERMSPEQLAAGKKRMKELQAEIEIEAKKQ